MSKYYEHITESVWSDIHKRSNGEQIRKEDTFQELLRRYVALFAYVCYYQGQYDSQSCPDFTDFVKDYANHPKIKILDPDIHELTNYINHTENWNNVVLPLIKKEIEKVDKDEEKLCNDIWNELHNTNESVWSDIHNRSNGEQIRKEDDLNLEETKKLVNCIEWFAARVVWNQDYEATLDDLCTYIEDFFTKGSKIRVDIPKFINNVKVKWDSFYKGLVGEFINKEKADYMKGTIKESVWSDIHKRSNGEQVREEDVTESDKEEIEGCVDTLAYIVLYFNEYEFTLDGLCAYIQEFFEDKDNSKTNAYVHYVKKHWVDTYEKLLQKSIAIEKKRFTEKIDARLHRFVNDIVYCEKYNVTLSDIKKFDDDFSKRGGNGLERISVGKRTLERYMSDIFYSYIKDNWNTGDNIRQRIEDFISEEEKQISECGFKKEPGKTISDTLGEWWESLSDDVRDDIFDNELWSDAEERFYEDHLDDDEFTGEDLDIDEEWDNLPWIRQVKIFTEYSSTNESVWSDIHKRSNGEKVRKEDGMNQDDFLMLRETAKMFRNVLNRSANEPWSDTCDNFIKYINLRKKEHFWNDTPDEVYDKVIKFVKDNWGDCTGIQEFMDKYLSNINECEGVPGGATPSNVGGMGAAYFPGPNGEPGSGDLPSPTGIVYHQVAPFGLFINAKKGKKKKKKFRKEDELCVHSENPPIYSHVDDFRDYVDRVYNQIDRKK